MYRIADWSHITNAHTGHTRTHASTRTHARTRTHAHARTHTITFSLSLSLPLSLPLSLGFSLGFSLCTRARVAAPGACMAVPWVGTIDSRINGLRQCGLGSGRSHCRVHTVRFFACTLCGSFSRRARRAVPGRIKHRAASVAQVPSQARGARVALPGPGIVDGPAECLFPLAHCAVPSQGARAVFRLHTARLFTVQYFACTQCGSLSRRARGAVPGRIKHRVASAASSQGARAAQCRGE